MAGIRITNQQLERLIAEMDKFGHDVCDGCSVCLLEDALRDLRDARQALALHHGVTRLMQRQVPFQDVHSRA